MWDIVSFGDVNTLNSVFNAIASIFNGNGFIAAASALALLVIVGSSLGSLASSQQELPFPKMMGAIIVFAMGFATFTNVSIENRYTGEVTQVDNIPVAIAVPASLISTIGLWLAETTETAFGSTGMNRVTENGYLAPLKVFSQYRAGTSLPCEVGSDIATVNGVNLCYTIPMYYSECTMVKAKKTNDYLSLKEGDALSEMNFNSRAFATNVMNASGQITTKSCADAYNDINNAMNSDGFSAIADAIAFPTGLRDGENGLIKTNDALEAIQADSGRNRAYMQATFARSLAEQGELAFYYRMGASDIAENIQSSIEQRNYQWALQGTLWVQIVDKFISLMECLIFALAPFIGLSVLMGSTGAKTVLLYLQMLAIIQIIPAMLVVAQSIVMNDMELTQSLLAMKYDVGSYAYNDAISEKAKELMGLGGMISSTIVPALAMALVTGSGMAVMGAFRQVGGAGKDSDATPDIAGQGGSTTKYDGLNSGKIDEHGNVMTERALSNVGSIGQSTDFKQSVQSAEQQKNMASQAYQESLANSQQTLNSQSYTASSVQSMGNNIQSSLGNETGWQSSIQQSLSKNTSLSDDQSNRVVEAASVGLTVASMGGSVKEIGDTLQSKSEKDAFNSIVSGEEGKGIRAQFSDALQASQSNGETISTGNSDIDSALSSVQKSNQEMKSAEDSYSQMQELQNTFSLSNDDIRTYMSNSSENETIMDESNKMISGLSDNEKQTYLDHLDRYNGGMDANNMKDNTASLMALAATSNEHGLQVQFSEVLLSEGNDKNLVDSSIAPINNTESTDFNYGELNRQNIDAPLSSDKSFKNDFDDYKDDLTEQSLHNKNSVNIEQYNDRNRETISSGEDNIKSQDIETLENTKDYANTSIDRIGHSINEVTDSIEEHVDSVLSPSKDNQSPPPIPDNDVPL